METWIVALIAPAFLTILGWLTNKTDKTAKLVALLQAEVDRLSERVKDMDAEVIRNNRTIAQERATIQEAYKCKTPSYRCPVLIKQAELYNLILCDDQRNEEQQPGQHPAQQDAVPGAGCGCGSEF